MHYLFVGLGLGLGAGLSPGPLMALVITTTLSRGLAAGIRVAVAPLVSDIVVITLCVLVVGSLPTRATSLLGVTGGLYVIWLGIEAMREVPVSIEAAIDDGPGMLRRGVLVNLLSPHAWLFWLTIGSPILLAAWASSALAAVSFLIGFFSLLVGTKIVVAILAATGRRRLTEAGRHRAHQIAGALLVLTGLILAWEFTTQLLAT